MPRRHRVFEWFLSQAERELRGEHDPAHVSRVLAQAREEYATLRPRVPDIGGRANVFQPVMTLNGGIVALHLAMKAHGHEARDVIALSHRVADRLLRRIPGPVLRLAGRLLLSAPSRRYFERQARRSQQRRFAADFVWRVEQDPDGQFSFVFDECAVNKWYDEIGVPELSPYCNFADVTYSRLMNMGIDASETIGQGCAQCALRFKQGRATEIPSNLSGVVTGG